MRALILLSAAFLAGCTATERPSEQAALADVPGRAVGDPVSCIRSVDVERVEAVNDYVAFIHMRGKRVYRTDFAQGCRNLGRDAFRHTSSMAQYCRGDIITTFDPTSGFTSGSCVFGSFVPYELPKRGAED